MPTPPTHYLLPRISTVEIKPNSAYPVKLEVWDPDNPDQTYTLEMTSIDAVRLGQRLTDAGRQVHAERKAQA